MDVRRRRDRQDAQGGPGGGRDARRHPGRASGPGVTTAELDQVAREVLERRGARSNFLNYHGFPAVICTSPNDMIVHGIPGGYRPGGGRHHLDRLRGHRRGLPRRRRLHRWGSATISPAAEKLMRVTEESLWAGIDQMQAGNRLHDIGLAVQTVAEGAGFSVVREYVGHAIGTAMHEEPQVPNYWPGTPGPKLQPGMVFAVEPMVNVGGQRDPGPATTAGAWSPPTAACPPTSSTPSPSPTTAPRCCTALTVT